MESSNICHYLNNRISYLRKQGCLSPYRFGMSVSVVSIRAIKSTHLSFSTTAQNEMAIPHCRRLTSRLQGILHW